MFESFAGGSYSFVDIVGRGSLHGSDFGFVPGKRLKREIMVDMELEKAGRAISTLD